MNGQWHGITAVAIVATLLLFSAAANATPILFNGDDTKLVDGNTVFHRLYVLGNGNSASENSSFEDDLTQLRTELEKAGRQANGSTSQILRQPTIAQLQTAITNVINGAGANSEITFYFSGHGGTAMFNNMPAEGNEPTGYDQHIRLRNDARVTDDQFKNMLMNLPGNVTFLGLFDSCFGGGFTGGANDLAAGDKAKVIGPSITCPTDPPGLFGWFRDTITEDIAKKAAGGGTVSGSDLETFLTGEGWSLGPPASGEGNKNGKTKCEGCVLPQITGKMVNNMLFMSGENFSPLSAVGFELITEDMTRTTIGSAMTDSSGSFMGARVGLPPFAPATFLILATDRQGFDDWTIFGVPEPGTAWLVFFGLIVLIQAQLRRWVHGRVTPRSSRMEGKTCPPSPCNPRM